MSTSVVVRLWLGRLVTLLSIAIAFTGILLILGLRVPRVRALHEVSGVTLVAAGLLHGVVNWRTLVAYFRKPRGWFTLVAGGLLCVALLWAGSVKEGRHGDAPGQPGHGGDEQPLERPGTPALG